MSGSKTDREAFLLAIRANPEDVIARLVFADWCEDHDDPKVASALRAGTFQATAPGTKIVVAGVDGQDPDNLRSYIYTTKIYEAVPRKSDGVLTWRLVGRVEGHRTSSTYPRRDVIERADAYAAANGLRRVGKMTHGTRCD